MSGGGDAEPGGGLPDAGQRGAQVALDVDGERLERADVEHPAALRAGRPGGGSVASRSSDQRNAARVLPEPVGATTRALRPALIDCQAPAWAAVGAANAAANHSRVAAPKSASTAASPPAVSFATPPSCPARSDTPPPAGRGVLSGSDSYATDATLNALSLT